MLMVLVAGWEVVNKVVWLLGRCGSGTKGTWPVLN
jgi:hypothetical protein